MNPIPLEVLRERWYTKANERTMRIEHTYPQQNCPATGQGNAGLFFVATLTSYLSLSIHFMRLSLMRLARTCGTNARTSENNASENTPNTPFPG